MVGATLKKQGVALKERGQCQQLVALIVQSLDVAKMRRLIYEVREGSGDITIVLDDLFEDVLHALQESKQGALGMMEPEELEDLWETGRDALKEQIEAKLREMGTKCVTRICGLKKKAYQEYVRGLFEHLGLEASGFSGLGPEAPSFEGLDPEAHTDGETMG